MLPVSSFLCGVRTGGGLGLGGITLFGSNQTFGSIADQILPTELDERLADKRGILGSVVLKQGALQLLFVVVGGYVDRLHIQRVDPCIEHDR